MFSMFMYVLIAVAVVGGVWFIYQLWKDDVASRKRSLGQSAEF
jgi:hypothetical protein